MKAKDFIEKLSLNTNGPAYRGAEQPKEIPTSINESNFCDELRCKSMSYKNDDDMLYIDWVSYEWPDDEFEECSRLFAEIGRTIKENADLCKVEDEIKVYIIVDSNNNVGDDDDQHFEGTVHIIPETPDKHSVFIWKD